MNNSQARRPADVYLPAFAGSPTAFDFAITAPQRQETLAQASVRTAAAAEAYARHKELHLHTAQACEQQGIKFVPLVAECTGTWDPSALKVLKHVAHAAAAKTGEEPAVCYNQLLQELGTTIRSFRARAALRRRFEAS
jgi:cytochrome c5